MNTNNYLVHHGIKGQHWGKKNGPPYPLDFNKLSSEEKQKAKDDVIRRGDIESANRNRDHFTDQELRDTMNRFDVNKKLSEYNKNLNKSVLEKTESLANKIGRIADSGEKVIKGYNFFVKISNSLLDTEYKPIGINKTKKTFSFDSKKLKDMIENPDKYSDDELQNATKRLSNINKLNGKEKNSKDDKDDN